MDNSFTCLYCAKETQASQFSLEHAIPQFMGGEYAPKFFQLTNVCRSCNNNLGLWVDAFYAKSWFVTNYMAEAARSLCTKLEDPGLPLRYLGKMKLPNLNVPDNYLAESWLGPSGESVIWIRPHDERMDSYAGGNPTDTNRKQSVAYFFPVSDSPEKTLLGMRSFYHALKKRKVRKILCANVHNFNGELIDPQLFGFDSPISEDFINQDIIRAALDAGNIHGQVNFNAKFDQRFMYKLMLGVGYALFGEEFLNHSVVREAQKGVWPSFNGVKSIIRGASTLSLFGGYNPLSVAGYPGAVAIIVMETGSSWSMCLSIDEKIPFTIELGPSSMTSQYIKPEEGYVLLLFPYRKESVELTVVELLAHRLGCMINPELNRLDVIRKAAAQFNEQLSNFSS